MVQGSVILEPLMLASPRTERAPNVAEVVTRLPATLRW